MYSISGEVLTRIYSSRELHNVMRVLRRVLCNVNDRVLHSRVLLHSVNSKVLKIILWHVPSVRLRCA